MGLGLEANPKLPDFTKVTHGWCEMCRQTLGGASGANGWGKMLEGAAYCRNCYTTAVQAKILEIQLTEIKAKISQQPPED